MRQGPNQNMIGHKNIINMRRHQLPLPIKNIKIHYIKKLLRKSPKII
jgi:hypothetical protein